MEGKEDARGFMDFHSSIKRGLFVTIEGVETTGKTSVLVKIEEYLKKRVNVKTLSEFSNSIFGDTLKKLLERDSLLRMREDIPTSLPETFLILGENFYQFEKIILPELKKGSIFLKDRFIDTVVVYQTCIISDEYSLPKEEIIKWFEKILSIRSEMIPDLTIILYAPFEIIKKRFLDREKRDFSEYEEKICRNVNDLFLNLQNLYSSAMRPERIRIFNSEKRLDELASEIIREIERELSKRCTT
jgi:dTMP kinase